MVTPIRDRKNESATPRRKNDDQIFHHKRGRGGHAPSREREEARASGKSQYFRFFHTAGRRAQHQARRKAIASAAQKPREFDTNTRNSQNSSTFSRRPSHRHNREFGDCRKIIGKKPHTFNSRLCTSVMRAVRQRELRPVIV